MSFDNEHPEENPDPHGECRHEIHRPTEVIHRLSGEHAALQVALTDIVRHIEQASGSAWPARLTTVMAIAKRGLSDVGITVKDGRGVYMTDDS